MCIIRLLLSKKYRYIVIDAIARYSYRQNTADQLSVVRSSGQALAVRTLSSHSHSVIAVTSWCIGVITLVRTRVMYPLHPSTLVQMTLVIRSRQLGREVLPCNMYWTVDSEVFLSLEKVNTLMLQH
jgi:hypothetical protein